MITSFHPDIKARLAVDGKTLEETEVANCLGQMALILFNPELYAYAVVE